MQYSLWLILWIFPSLMLWFFNYNILKRYIKTIAHIIFFSMIIGAIWDFFALKNNIWKFPRTGNMGIYIGLLPLEEYLFYITSALFVSTVTIILKYQKHE